MNKKYYYLLSSLLLLLLAIIISSCGGGGDNGVIPNAVNQQPQLVQKNVSGYIYHLPEQGVNDFIIIDAPVSGDDSFLSQMKSYLETNYTEVWNSSEIQSIYNQLSSEITGWQALPKYNPGAQLFCAYSDTPIPVGEDGYFEAIVSIPAGDENVTFEVVIGEEAFGTDTIASSDFITSSIIGTGQLKCSNKSIIALPGGLSIFKVFTIPGTNLKDTLVFELDDNSIGTMTPPFFLKINGEVNYNLAYGVFKANNISAKSAETKVSNGNGNNLYIPTDIVHETVSISGKVYTGGEPLLNGHVISIGPNSSSFLDEEGNYVLPKVFKGAYRKVTASWWTGDQQGNNKTKHTEIRYVEYLDGDLTGFNFGVPVEPTVTPTPIATPTLIPTQRNPISPIYDYTMSTIIEQFNQWEQISETEIAVQKTMNWLNGYDLTLHAPEEILEAKIDLYDNTKIWIYFSDNHRVCLNVGSEQNNISNKNFNYYLEKEKTSITSPIVTSSVTVASMKILILVPFFCEDETNLPPEYNTVYERIADELKAFKYPDGSPVYDVHDVKTGGLGTTNDFDTTNIRSELPATYIVITDYTLEIANHPGLIIGSDVPKQLSILEENKNIIFNTYDDFVDVVTNQGLSSANIENITPYLGLKPGYPDIEIARVYHLFIKSGHENNIVTINDFLNLSQYGVIAIFSHGTPYAILATYIYQNDTQTSDWLEENLEDEYDPYYNINGTWHIEYRKYKGLTDAYKALSLTKNFFNRQSYSSIIYMGTCSSWYLKDAFMNNGAKTYLGYVKPSRMEWNRNISYVFFDYIIYGDKTLTDPVPMSVKEAFNTLGSKGFNPDSDDPQDPPCELMITTKQDNTYFPAPVNYMIHRE